MTNCKRQSYFELTNGKTYRELSATDKELIQNRQTHLAIAWQDEKNALSKLEIEDELMASFKGLIKGMAYRQAEKSFSLDQEEFEGIISLAFAETLVSFDRTLDKPFQPVFITMVRYAILEMYREKGYDLHDTADKLDKPSSFNSQFDNEETATYGERLVKPNSFSDDLETQVVTDEVLTELFGQDDKKKTIVHMTVQGFKRNEIVTAIKEEGKTTDGTVRMINRTVKQFREHYLNLMQGQLV